MISTRESLKGVLNVGTQIVKSAVLEEITVDVSTETQSISPSENVDGFSKVTINPVTKEIDENIQSSNIKEGTTILGVNGEVVDIKDAKLQDKTVEPKTYLQTVTADDNYDSLGTVTVKAVTSAIDNSIQAENIKKGVTILGVEGSIEDKPADPILQNKTVDASTGKQIITADNGYDGLGQVTINEVTSSIDGNIKPSNIKQGVSILGVQGTLEQGAEVVKKYKPKFISFQSAPAIDLSEETRMLDTSLITSMTNMFSSSYATNIDVSEWDTSNVTNMTSMFYYSKFATLDLSNWDTSNVTIMDGMFQSASNLTYLDLSNFNTYNVKSGQAMANMFARCSNLVELNISNFTFSKSINVSAMFQYCRKLQKLDVRNCNFSIITSSYSYMLEEVPTNCLIITKDETEKTWWQKRAGTSYTNIKTLAEYQAEGGV